MSTVKDLEKMVNQFDSAMDKVDAARNVFDSLGEGLDKFHSFFLMIEEQVNQIGSLIQENEDLRQQNNELIGHQRNLANQVFEQTESLESRNEYIKKLKMIISTSGNTYPIDEWLNARRKEKRRERDRVEDPRIPFEQTLEPHEIDRIIHSGIPTRTLGKEYRVSRMAIQRIRDKHKR